MSRQPRAALLLAMLAPMLTGAPEVTAASQLPDPHRTGVAERLYRLDCGHSLANDESVWTPGENVGRDIEFSSTCWLIKHGAEWLLWDTGVPETAHNDPKGWSTLPKLIVYHLDKIADRSARRNRLKARRHRPCRDIAHAWRPHRQHGDVPQRHSLDAAS